MEEGKFQEQLSRKKRRIKRNEKNVYNHITRALKLEPFQLETVGDLDALSKLLSITNNNKQKIIYRYENKFCPPMPDKFMGYSCTRADFTTMLCQENFTLIPTPLLKIIASYMQGPFIGDQIEFDQYELRVGHCQGEQIYLWLPVQNPKPSILELRYLANPIFAELNDIIFDRCYNYYCDQYGNDIWNNPINDQWKKSIFESCKHPQCGMMIITPCCKLLVCFQCFLIEINHNSIRSIRQDQPFETLLCNFCDVLRNNIYDFFTNNYGDCYDIYSNTKYDNLYDPPYHDPHSHKYFNNAPISKYDCEHEFSYHDFHIDPH